MSGELIVAVVSVVMAGFAGPLITAAATTSGQKRKFRDEQIKKDQAEVRKLLDEAIEAMDLVEVSSARLEAAYFQHGSTREPYEDLLGRAQEATRILRHVKARLAIRLGDDEPIGHACSAALRHADAISAAIGRYLTLGSATPEPRFTDIQKAVTGIDESRNALVVAAFRAVGASLSV